MKRPSHLVLDFEKSMNSSTNWSMSFVENSYTSSHVLQQVNLKKKTYLKTHKNSSKRFKFKVFQAKNKFTVIYSDFVTTLPKALSPKQKLDVNVLPYKIMKNKKDLIVLLSERTTSQNPVKGLNTQDITKETKSNKFDKLTEERSVYYTYIYRKLYIILTNTSSKKRSKANLLNRLTIVNFLRKERLYTKLKYSRSPAYDIVSGGAAALLAGFIGFLISEKYGFELVDSGDFYYLFMYMVFLGFSIRPFLTSIDQNKSLGEILSPKFFLDYYLNLIRFFFRKFY